MLTVPKLLRSTVGRHRGATALIAEGRRWAYSEWFARIESLAAALSDVGIRAGDRVALYLENGEPFLTSYFAAQLLGAVAVPINFRLSPGEAAFIIGDCQARILIYSGRLAENARSIAALIDCEAGYVASGDGDTLVSFGHHDFEALAGNTDGPAVDVPDIEPSQLTALVYTSGTTGRPKGVMHTHANDVAIAMNCVMEYSLNASDVALHVAPLSHVGGMQAWFLPHLMVGAANVILSRYTARDALDAIQGAGVTNLFVVPTQILEMLFDPDFSSLNLSRLRMITTGGAPITAPLMERVIREFCPNVFNGYGMTEASLTLLLHPQDALSRLGSCGRPTLISECRIAGASGAEAATGEIGELAVRGPQVTPGYWNNPDETGGKLRNGWLRTGDLFSRDADGFHFFHGRADDMIVSGGENIYPRELEEILAKCPGLKDVAVAGLPDEKWGSAVTAFVVRAAPDLTEQAVDSFCRANRDLASFKRPKRIIFVDALPSNPSGKILRRELVRRFAGAPAR